MELKEDFDLHTALTRGLLPQIFHSELYLEDLKDYVELYLREEIAKETQIRNLPAFSRFLDVAALCNSQIINYENIAQDSQVSASTIREYFQVLQDTLIIERLPAWRQSKKRKASAKDKFYFFDIGVARYLQGRKDIVEETEDFGAAFETYLYHELRSYCSYQSNESLSYWRTTSGQEVDFLLGEHTAIELKATRKVSAKHLKGLVALQEEKCFQRYILVSRDSRERTQGECHLLPYERFIDLLWQGEFS